MSCLRLWEVFFLFMGGANLRKAKFLNSRNSRNCSFSLWLGCLWWWWWWCSTFIVVSFDDLESISIDLACFFAFIKRSFLLPFAVSVLTKEADESEADDELSTSIDWLDFCCFLPVDNFLVVVVVVLNDVWEAEVFSNDCWTSRSVVRLFVSRFRFVFTVSSCFLDVLTDEKSSWEKAESRNSSVVLVFLSDFSFVIDVDFPFLDADFFICSSK